MLFAIVGTASNVITFVCLSVLFIIVCSFALGYAAHCYLVVVQGTVAGVDRVEWPEEPFYNWLLDVVWLGGLAVCWLAPLGLLARGLSDVFLPDEPILRFTLIVGCGLWLAVPFALLSAMASSQWTPFSFRVLLNLFRIAGSVVVFYFFAGLLVVVSLAALWAGVLWDSWLPLPFTAVICAAAWLIHARLMGRLGWVLGQLTQREKPPAARKHKAGKKAVRSRNRRSRAVAVEDPWAVPEDEEEHGEGDTEEGYGIKEEKTEGKRLPRPAYLDPEPEPCTLEEQPARVVSKPSQEERSHLKKEKIEREIALRRRRPPNPPPAYPMLEGTFTFPIYEPSLKAWFGLGIWLLLAGGVLRLVLMTAPF